MFLQVIAIGRLPQDPELQYTESGTAMVEFSVVDDRTHEDEVQYPDVIDWGDAAENHNEYLEKGSLVAVIGGLDLGKWEDDDGKTRYAPQILAGRYGGRVVYLGSSSSNGGDSESEDSKPTSDDEEEIPF